MIITYEFSRYHARALIECRSVREAIMRAWNDLEMGEAFPCTICQDNTVLWRENGPLTVTSSLIEFAAQHGVSL